MFRQLGKEHVQQYNRPGRSREMSFCSIQNSACNIWRWSATSRLVDLFSFQNKWFSWLVGYLQKVNHIHSYHLIYRQYRRSATDNPATAAVVAVKAFSNNSVIIVQSDYSCFWMLVFFLVAAWIVIPHFFRNKFLGKFHTNKSPHKAIITGSELLCFLKCKNAFQWFRG